MTHMSKLAGIPSTCIEYMHPWTDHCVNATAGLLLQSCKESLRIYSAVYLLSLVMRGKIPTRKDIKRTIQGMLQSTAFLTTNAFTFSMFVCLLRRWLGKLYFLTVAFVPSWLASFFAILVERPSRRGLLCLYVANVATETYWRMLESRGLVHPVKHGRVMIFGLSATLLLFYYRSGLHKTQNDGLFDIIRFVVGKSEEAQPPEEAAAEPPRPRPSFPLGDSLRGIRERVINFLRTLPRHFSCPHRGSCASYTLHGGSKLFCVGLGLQLTLSLVFQMGKIIRNPGTIKRILRSRDVVKIALFLGGFSALFRATSCSLRHLIGRDSPFHAVPAGLLASTMFSQYPDTSVCLYIMWKMLQITYKLGIERKILPRVPGATIFLYCTFTATLFHAAMVEPLNLRPSYWKFLHSLSGGRSAVIDRVPIDQWGLDTSRALKEVLRRTRTDQNLKFLL
ncbi:transmembrane protein 135-like [Phlebotomus argentipes]|uniref:transmembrane protein 135-like n=1 Tax=Phlebotomus argentipes TaxID=94469 RepID=UPI00289311E0|nr:transmembrane protein 135-like [Phlebotomus argentipes]